MTNKSPEVERPRKSTIWEARKNGGRIHILDELPAGWVVAWLSSDGETIAVGHLRKGFEHRFGGWRFVEDVWAGDPQAADLRAE